MTVETKTHLLQANTLIDNGSLVNVVRFADTTCRSRDVRHLLQTVVAQLSAAVCPSSAATVVPAAMDKATSYDDVRAHFRCLVDSFPPDQNLVIFVDGIDRLIDIRSSQVIQRCSFTC